MSIIVALFMGLTVSAEEIIRDRKILKRESFLNLSWNSYLVSKVIILFSLSAIQTLTFVIIGNLVLEIEWSMLIPFWFVLFTTSCMANVLGLNISSAFNSAVTVYVMIPLLLIPQMILSGLLFSFDKLNSVISTKGKVPLVADLMASRWAYEAMAVYQFKYNSYQKPFYGYEQIESQADFKSSFYVDKLNEKRKYIADNIQSKNDTVNSTVVYNLELIRNSIKDDYYKKGLEKIDVDSPWTIETYTPAFSSLLEDYLSSYKQFYQSIYNKAVAAREKIIYDMENAKGTDYKVYEYKNKYYNESLADLVKNVSVKTRIVEDNGELVQQINPVFVDPKPTSALDYRAQFFAPRKNLLGIQVDTYYFNILVIWLTCFTFYITLYFELLRKFVNMFSKVNLPSNVTLPKMNLKKKK
jgi:hypothetical protein